MLNHKNILISNEGGCTLGMNYPDMFLQELPPKMSHVTLVAILNFEYI